MCGFSARAILLSDKAEEGRQEFYKRTKKKGKRLYKIRFRLFFLPFKRNLKRF